MSIRVAAIQTALARVEDNVAHCLELVRRAADDGAQIVLLPELFEGPYFPQSQREELFELARPVAEHPTLTRFQSLAAELEVVLPVSFFERDGNHYFNSVAVFDANGRNLGVYRKSHIPDGPGYQEKFYFKPGHTGFSAFDTRYGCIGVAICWDQWFPEAARCMALAGADILFYPTAIGSEPHDPDLDTSQPWRRVMQGHAVANATWVVAANRIGKEGEMEFYGQSFIANHRGELVADGGAGEEILAADIDLQATRQYRASFGFFRDRRPELYGPLSDPKT
ncbi:MAG: N-carbamoylputrescine amidase [Deltaproteobacteria bacterium]|nr:N-carbamoylputrescine amidase [Deltaproteobacteria bacterium]